MCDYIYVLHIFLIRTQNEMKPASSQGFTVIAINEE